MAAGGDAGTGADAVLSRRPYLLRAMHEWMADAGFTPHVIVDAARAGVEVPAAYVKDGRIVLNVSMNATQRLQLLNHGIEFDARFAGVVHHVRVPIGAVLGIYARETGEGMVFNEGEPETPPPADGGAPATTTGKGETRRAKLTVVK
ncbi:MAG TPA: ClpXP protease specificity-enhancing factor [Burkholderiaceae bacterium]|nr:ClpXP protease specificity-enhancing factor [Burkholderiaceae bacterium]